MARIEAPSTATTANPPNRFVALARKAYRPLGFRRGYAFAFFVLTAGAFLAFSLSRAMFLDYSRNFCGPANTPGVGECFFFARGRPSATGMIVHLATALPLGLLVTLQFLPVIRSRWMTVHRVVGHVCIALLLAAAGTGIFISKNSFGGGLDTRLAVVTMGGWTLACVGLAYWNIRRRQVEEHRAWMIRGWIAAGSIITMRIIQYLTSRVVARQGDVYQARSCAQIDYLLSGNATLAMSLYPSCTAFYSGADPGAHAAVKAAWPGLGRVSIAAALGSAFGPSAWFALVLHVLCAEIYLHLTTTEHARLREVSYARQRDASMKNSGSAGLTADRLGDAPGWEPKELEEARRRPAAVVLV